MLQNTWRSDWHAPRMPTIHRFLYIQQARLTENRQAKARRFFYARIASVMLYQRYNNAIPPATGRSRLWSAFCIPKFVRNDVKLCNEAELPYRRSYQKRVKAVEYLRRVLAPMHSKYQFAKWLFDKPVGMRYSVLEQMYAEYIKEHPRMRIVVRSRIEQSLKAIEPE